MKQWWNAILWFSPILLFIFSLEFFCLFVCSVYVLVTTSLSGLCAIGNYACRLGPHLLWSSCNCSFGALSLALSLSPSLSLCLSPLLFGPLSSIYLFFFLPSSSLHSLHGSLWLIPTCPGWKFSLYTHSLQTETLRCFQNFLSLRWFVLYLLWNSFAIMVAKNWKQWYNHIYLHLSFKTLLWLTLPFCIHSFLIQAYSLSPGLLHFHSSSLLAWHPAAPPCLFSGLGAYFEG